MFDIVVGVTNTPIDHLEKDFIPVATLQGILRDSSSIINPVVLIETTLPTNWNYAVISTFGRKYYIRDIVSIRTGLVELTLHVDVLATYADQIRNHTAVIARNAYKYNLFLPDTEVKCYQRPHILTEHFSGQLPPGMVTLVVAGSGGTSSQNQPDPMVG